MTISVAASLSACALFVAAMVHVMFTDLLHRRIRNWLIAALMAAYAPLAVAAGVPPGETGMALLAGALVFAGCFACFAAGWVGGGDAKLAPACVLWLGADQALQYLLLASLLGGALTLALLLTGFVRRQPAGVSVSGERANQRTVPYGVALAFAALMLLPGSPWAGAL